MTFNNYLLNKKYYDLLYKFNPLTKSSNEKLKGHFFALSSLMHILVHKVDEVILTPELFLLLLNGKR